MDYIVTAIDHFGNSFRAGEAYLFKVSAASEGEVREILYSDHPKVCVAWIGKDPAPVVREDRPDELEETDGVTWKIEILPDYNREGHAYRLEAGRLPEEMEEGMVDFGGCTYHISDGYVRRRVWDGYPPQYPYLPYAGGLSSDTPSYKEWRRSVVTGRGRQWSWA